MPRDRFTKPSLLLAAVLAAVAVLAPSLRAQNAAHDADYSYPPRERMADYLKRTVGPGGLFNAAFLGGMDQWRDKPEGWEQGGAGYGKRFASRLGRGAMGNTIQLGVEALLHEDSRYTSLQHGSVGRRIGHSLSHSFMVRTPDGRRAPPIGRFAGIVGGAILSRRWYPVGENTFEDGARAAGISLGMFTTINVVREFLPDIKRLFGRN
jgi:hypothetical protein